MDYRKKFVFCKNLMINVFSIVPPSNEILVEPLLPWNTAKDQQ